MLASLIAALSLGLPAPAAASTLFSAQFVCNDRGVVFPLVGAKVDFVKVLDSRYESYNEVVQQTLTTDTEGRVSAGVNAPQDWFAFRVYLQSPEAKATEWWWYDRGDPSLNVRTDLKLNNEPVQDFGTQEFSVIWDGQSPECAIFEGVRRAYRDYAANANNPRVARRFITLGTYAGADPHPSPYADLIAWPYDFPTGQQPGTFGSSFSVFGKTIYQELTGLQTLLNRNTFSNGDHPCLRTDEGTAFLDGWGLYWSGAYAPAPHCPGIPATDYRVAGNVAAALTGLDRYCPGVERPEMVAVFARNPGRIFSFNDFRRALGCSGLKDAVTSSVHSPSGLSIRQQTARVRRELHSLALIDAALGKQFRQAKTRARHAPCPPLPCTDAVRRVVAPPLLISEIDQARTLGTTLRPLTSAKVLRHLRTLSQAQLRADAIKRAKVFHKSVVRIGAKELRLALQAARRILRRDHTLATANLATSLREILNQFRHGHVPAGFASLSGESKLRATAPWTPPSPTPNLPPLPDLVVDSITGFAHSANPALHMTVRNIGDGPAPASKLLLHSRSSANNVDVDHVFDVPALAPGASVTIDAPCDNTLAAYAADSATATADSTNVVAERDESNNSLSVSGNGEFCVFI